MTPARNAEDTVKNTTMRVSTMAAAVLAATIGFTFLFAQQPAAQTAELRVMCSNGVKSAVEELRPQIERAAGRRLAIQFDSSVRLVAKIDAGEAFDLAFLSPVNMDPLIQKGVIAASPTAYIGRTGIGIGVRAGARKPDLSSTAALKQTLLSAKSITMNPTGASATHFNRIVAELGIADAVKPKIILDAEPGRAQMNVAEGKAELIWTQIPEIKSFRELEFAGPLPKELQVYTDFSVAVATKTRDAAAAAAVVKSF